MLVFSARARARTNTYRRVDIRDFYNQFLRSINSLQIQAFCKNLSFSQNANIQNSIKVNYN